jgi:hypothetical protein
VKNISQDPYPPPSSCPTSGQHTRADHDVGLGVPPATNLAISLVGKNVPIGHIIWTIGQRTYFSLLVLHIQHILLNEFLAYEI